MTMLHEIATEQYASPSAKIETLLDAACAFDASAFDILYRIEADLVAAVERGDWEAVDSLVVHRRLHKQTREILLQQAEAAIRRVDAGVILRDLLAA